VDLRSRFFQALLLCPKDRYDLGRQFRKAFWVIADSDFSTDIKPSAFCFGVAQGKYLLSEIFYRRGNFPAAK